VGRETRLVDLVREGAAAPTEVAEAPRKEQTVLVVDDNPGVLRLMRSLLQRDYDVLVCDNARAALRLAAERRPDIVLCDVMMPEIDGHTFCRQVKADPVLRSTPVMLVTARASTDMLVEGIDAGADDYLVKPFEPEELRARVRSLLRMRAAEAQLARVNENLRARAEDLAARQRDLFLATVKSLVSALDAKDRYTRNHSQRVTDYSLAVARHLGFAERDLQDLELAGLLHDIGKIGVPETVLH
jgi:putative two-component system response regulator